MTGACRISVNNSTPIRAKVNASVDAWIAGDRGIGECVLMLIVVDPVPAGSGIVGSINSPDARHLGAAVKGRIFVERRGLAEANRAGGVDGEKFEKGITAIRRMPYAVDSCGASTRQPDVAFVPGR